MLPLGCAALPAGLPHSVEGLNFLRLLCDASGGRKERSEGRWRSEAPREAEGGPSASRPRSCLGPSATPLGPRGEEVAREVLASEEIFGSGPNGFFGRGRATWSQARAPHPRLPAGHRTCLQASSPECERTGRAECRLFHSTLCSAGAPACVCPPCAPSNHHVCVGPSFPDATIQLQSWTYGPICASSEPRLRIAVMLGDRPSGCSRHGFEAERDSGVRRCEVAGCSDMCEVACVAVSLVCGSQPGGVPLGSMRRQATQLGGWRARVGGGAGSSGVRVVTWFGAYQCSREVGPLRLEDATCG